MRLIRFYLRFFSRLGVTYIKYADNCVSLFRKWFPLGRIGIDFFTSKDFNVLYDLRNHYKEILVCKIEKHFVVIYSHRASSPPVFLPTC